MARSRVSQFITFGIIAGLNHILRLLKIFLEYTRYRQHLVYTSCAYFFFDCYGLHSREIFEPVKCQLSRSLFSWNEFCALSVPIQAAMNEQSCSYLGKKMIEHQILEHFVRAYGECVKTM